MMGVVLSVFLGYELDRQIRVILEQELVQQENKIFSQMQKRLNEYETLVNSAREMFTTPGIIANNAYQRYLDKLPVTHYPGLTHLRVLKEGYQKEREGKPWCTEQSWVSPLQGGDGQVSLAWYLPIEQPSSRHNPAKTGRPECVGSLEVLFDAKKVFDYAFEMARNQELGAQLTVLFPYGKGTLVFSEGVPPGADATNLGDNPGNPKFFFFSGKAFQVMFFPPPRSWLMDWAGYLVAAAGLLLSLWLHRVFHLRAEQKQEEAMRETQQRACRMERQHRLEVFAFVGHELASPFTLINSFLEVHWDTLQSHGLPQNILNDLAHVMECSKRTQVFIDEMIRTPGGKRVCPTIVLDIFRLVTALAETNSRFHGITVTYNDPDPELRVLANHLELELILFNMLRNSAEAIRDDNIGKSITLEAQADGDWARIRVEDDGPGLSNPDKLFELFESTKLYGLGLALAICKNKVESWGGSVEGGNRPEGGAWFELVLPLFRGDKE